MNTATKVLAIAVLLQLSLAALARARKGSMATLDRGLAAVHPDVAVWIGRA